MFDEKLQELSATVTEDNEHEDPVVYVAYYNAYTQALADPFTSTGFYVRYANIPQYDDDGNQLGLDINYAVYP